MPRALLLGGAGLIGTPVARALQRAGWTVVVVARTGQGAAPGVEVRNADRSDPASLSGALGGERFDLTVDLLAYTAADVARLHAVPRFQPGRIVMISTGQVYLVVEAPRPPFGEADAERPARPRPPPETRAEANWVYGVGKREAEAEVWAQSARSGTPAIVLRLPIVQGVGDRSRRLWAYLERMLDGGPVILPGGGTQPVRYVWAEDVGRLVAELAGRVAWPAGAFNVAMPDEPTLEEFLFGAAAALGVPPQLASCTEAELEAAGLDDALSPFSGPWCSRPSPARLEAELGFRTTPSPEWLPAVVAEHLGAHRPASHPSYAQREAELRWLAGRAGGSRR